MNPEMSYPPWDRFASGGVSIANQLEFCRGRCPHRPAGAGAPKGCLWGRWHGIAVTDERLASPYGRGAPGRGRRGRVYPLSHFVTAPPKWEPRRNGLPHHLSGLVRNDILITNRARCWCTALLLCLFIRTGRPDRCRRPSFLLPCRSWPHTSGWP